MFSDVYKESRLSLKSDVTCDRVLSIATTTWWTDTKKFHQKLFSVDLEGAKRQEKRQRLSQDLDRSTQPTQMPTQIPANLVSASKQSSSIPQPQSPQSQRFPQPPSQQSLQPSPGPSTRPDSKSPTLPSDDCDRSERKSSEDSDGLFPADKIANQPLDGAKAGDDPMDNRSADQTQITEKTLFGHDSLLDDSFDISVNQSSSDISLNQSSSSYASSTATLMPDDELKIDESQTKKSPPDISVLKEKGIPPPKNEIIDVLFERPLHEYYFCEIDLLKRFAEFIEEEDPDIILVWNRDRSIGTGSFSGILDLLRQSGCQSGPGSGLRRSSRTAGLRIASGCHSETFGDKP